jgi:hypothetical protein
MTLTDRIEINPRVMLGKPVIRGTRIPVHPPPLADEFSASYGEMALSALGAPTRRSRAGGPGAPPFARVLAANDRRCVQHLSRRVLDCLLTPNS